MSSDAPDPAENAEKKHMGRAARRAWLYGAGLALVGGLVYGGFIYEPEPDVMTILGSVDLSLKVVHRLPELGKDGKPSPYREGELTKAEALLRGVEEREPGLAITFEMRAFACYLKKDWSGAANLYRRALTGKEPDVSRRTAVLLNVAEMEREAGNIEGSLEALDRIGEQPASRIQVAMCRARTLERGGRREEALDVLRPMASLSSEDPARLLECGRLLEQLGDRKTAEMALEAAVPGTGEVALYYLARLKFLAGQTDMALTTLATAHRTGPAFVNKVLKRDHAIWEPLGKDPRLEQLLGEGARGAAAPGR